MNRREKYLLIVVVTMGVAVLGQFIFKKVSSDLEFKSDQAMALSNEITILQKKWLMLKRDHKQLQQYQVQSLPSNRPAAKSQYEAWLLNLASDVAGL